MKYSELFIGRPDTFAVAYQRGKGYRPVKRKLTPKEIGKHLRGDITAGIYLIRPKDHSVRVMALDVDKDDEALVKSIAQAAVQEVPDDSILIERTGGRGWHVWFFSDGWIEAKVARAFMRDILEKVDLTYPVELYPKQDRIRAEGLGNLVRLPLGKHPRTGEEGELFNAFGLPFEVEEGDDPELPLEPSPSRLIEAVANRKLEREKSILKGVPDDGGPTTLPCISRFQKGVGEGARDEAMFRLAAYLHRQQIPREAAWIVLEKSNELNKPPLEKTGLSDKLSSAYSGAGYGLPCSSDLVGLDSPFCDPTCPVYITAKSRSSGDAGFISSGVPSGRFPRIVERDGTYIFQTRIKQGLKETTLCNFTMEVLSRLEMPHEGADVLRVRTTTQGGRDDIMDIPVSAFSSRAMLLRLLVRAEYAWYGTDAHCQYLKAHLTSGEMETQQAITRLGRAKTEEGDVWVQTNGIITTNSTGREDSPFTYHRPEHFGIVNVKIAGKSFSTAKMKTVLKSLMRVNSLSVMVPTIGWAFSVPFKPWFMEHLGHFPLLMLYGTRGAGKTQMIQRSIMPLFGYNSREPQIFFCDTTRFVMVSYGASTTTVPLFFDEYRPNALPGTKLRMLWDHWRHLYAEDTDHRGQADLSRLSFKQTAPVIVAGEEMVLDPAMQERMIQVAMSPDYLTHERQRAFKDLPPLEMASNEFIRAALAIDPEPLADKARERISGTWERQVSPRIYDNLLVTAFGLEVWAKISGGKISKTMASSIFSLAHMVQDPEGEIRTPLWVDDFLLDIAGIVEEKGPFTWGTVEHEGDDSVLYINLRRAHAEWAKDMRSRGDQAVGIQPIKRQLDERAAAQFVMGKGIQKRMMGANTRVYQINLTAMREVIDE